MFPITLICFAVQKLERKVELLDIEEDYVKKETRQLQRELVHSQEVGPTSSLFNFLLIIFAICLKEVKRIQSVPLVIGQFLEAVDYNTAIVASTTGWSFCKGDNNLSTNVSLRLKLLRSHLVYS